MAAHDAIIENHMMQTHHANKKRRPGEIYRPGDLVYLSTKNLALLRGRAKKILPKYIGPYKIVEVHDNTSTVKLELPVELESRWISPTFHSSLIRPHIGNNDELFPKRGVKSHYDCGEVNDQEWFVDEIITHRWVDDKDLEFQVRWTLGDVTWEPLAKCKELEVLSSYLEHRGVEIPSKLPRHKRLDQ
jgi:hypothetical protein